MATADEEINIKVNSNIGDVGKDADKTSKALDLFKKGIRGIGTALKAAGIGLIVTILAKLMDALSKNQTVMDGFSTAMNAINIAISDLFKFIEENFMYL